MSKRLDKYLVEAIFEIRWGNPDKGSPGNIIMFPDEEVSFFVGEFKSAASTLGFSEVTSLNPSAPKLPHIVAYQFRKKPNTWPCYQIGLGVFTANQTRDKYDWTSFKNTIMEGLDLLDKSLPSKLNGMNPIGIELKYIDAFVYGDDPMDYLNKKFNIKMSDMIDDSFLNEKLLIDKPNKGISVAFQLDSSKPKGLFAFNLKQGRYNEEPCFVSDIRVRSFGNDISFKEKNLKDIILNWLEDSYKLQIHAFNTLVNKGQSK